MKKLTKKQAQIINDIKKSIDIDLVTLRKYNAEDNYEMVSHCQHSISDQLSGVSSYLIFCKNGVWDSRLANAYNEIRNIPELSLDYWSKCLDRGVEKENQ